MSAIARVLRHARGALRGVTALVLVALAIATPQRNPQLPDVPTVAESGIPGFDVTSWYGLIVRSGTPPHIVQKLHRDIAETLKQEDVRAKLAALGLEAMGNSPEAFQRMIKSESQKWSDIVRKANIQPQS